MHYEVAITRSAERELKSLSVAVAQRIGDRLRALPNDQHPGLGRRFKGSANFRRRVGDNRFIYAVEDQSRRVTILAIGHRRDVDKDR